ncbi:uroporphyrinogen decarboxylase [Nakamurella leprariae]|uniref:Uroporphyrinogen decarboxylase n=1 Tax=Nakamurella leprariae TaxID=2803911 RepID=A0A938Y7A1_9ACTN|nr:uroporphyrinogen decarboxylase [Nakamurella leprariae]MBM9467341.1 uroporphyrinogen decarboxylase [Nakamurella leprariae]
MSERSTTDTDLDPNADPAPAPADGRSVLALPADHPLRDGRTSGSPLVAAFTGGAPTRRPVWFMRQAGRSLPEYRAARAGVGMLESCLRPELAAEITLQPVRRHDVDAAVLFSDIVVPLKLAGVDVDIVAGVGPVMGSPVRTAADVAALPELDPAALAPVAAAAALTVAELGGVPLVGFAGAPFTLASYLVEGGPSREHLHTRALMHADPDTWHRLAAWTAQVTGAFLQAQVQAGASAVQLFDSWAGALSLPDYERFVRPHSAAVLAAIGRTGVPRVHFGVNTGELLVAMRDAGADVIGVDHRVPLDVASARLGHRTPVQGNIDPALLFAGDTALHEHTRDVLRRGRSAPGHVVNLGHGVPPETDPEVLTRLVAFVHDQP